MPSTYTTSGVELIGSGEQSGTWGTTTNTNLQILDRMISQAGTISLSGTTHTLTISDGILSDGQYAVLVFGGSPSGTNTVTISPNDAKRVFIVKNGSGQTVTLTQGSGGNVSVLNGRTALVYCDGAGAGAAVVNASDTFVSATTSAIGALTPTDGNFIVGNGSTWVAESGNTVLTSIGVTATFGELNTLDGITASTAELNILDGVTASTAELNLLDGVTATTAEINILDGVTATTAELNYVDGVTSSIQTQLDAKAANTTQLQATWEAGTGTTETIVSPAKVKAAIDALRPAPYTTDVATTSGTSHTLTGIPAGVNQVDVFFKGVSHNDNTVSGDLLIQLGTSGGIVSSGYSSASTTYAVTRTSTAGFILLNPGAAAVFHGIYRLRRIADGTDSWLMTGEGKIGGTAGIIDAWSDVITLAGALTQVRLTTAGGTPVFDAGNLSIRCY